VTVKFSLKHLTKDVFLDYRGKTVNSINVNGVDVKTGNECYRSHRIYLKKNLLKANESNVVIVNFRSEFVKDCEGMHYYKDNDDEREYIYTQFESVNAHKCFPCFDQPDLKAKYSLLVVVPEDWRVISNENSRLVAKRGEPEFTDALFRFNKCYEIQRVFDDNAEVTVYEFNESHLLSPYLYAIMAGPYAEILDHK
jgi:aminopeptidase N